MPHYDLVIAGGTVADAAGSSIADVAVESGRIAAVGVPGSFRDSESMIDATGLVVVPGGVDPHVHSATVLGEFETKDSFEQCTLAAAWGGTTTIVDFAIPQPPGEVGPLQCVEQRIELAEGSVIDVAFHACVSAGDESSLRDIGALSERGVTTVKVFTIYKGLVMLSLDEIYACMQATAAVGGMLLVHAESPHLIEPLRQNYIKRGQTNAYHHAASRPLESEVDMVRLVIELLRATRCRGYIVHVTAPEAIVAINDARLHGVKIWAETCPHYVFLDEEVYRGDNGELYICSPPIRPRHVAEQLWQMVCSGFVQVWGSDHTAYNSTQKFKYRGDFPKVPNGLPGVELRAPLLFSEGVVKGRMELDRFVALSAANPAKLNGLYPKKGSLAPGADADIAIYDPHATVTIDAKALHMITDYTPFDGMTLTGWPRTVISKGKTVIADGEYRGSAGSGQVLTAAKPTDL